MRMIRIMHEFSVHVLILDKSLAPYYLDPDAYTRLWVDTEVRMKPVLENLKPN